MRERKTLIHDFLFILLVLLSKPQGSLDKNVTNSYVFAFAEGCDAWVKVGLNVVYWPRVRAF